MKLPLVLMVDAEMVTLDVTVVTTGVSLCELLCRVEAIGKLHILMMSSM